MNEAQEKYLDNFKQEALDAVQKLLEYLKTMRPNGFISTEGEIDARDVYVDIMYHLRDFIYKRNYIK
ncbi:hypothetical protein [Capnocytophaga sp. oral taxon 324]|uniref:hypothetical protein n=1 Tax=Capnocytophaga sp. oral taxon 324 TaxID=712211 RepID=UPI0002A43CB7|nr:hypothetical protein [Capnocytophaga sp. oral taxon 324]EKY12955.1 hypothetical protein HMPREF9072_01757 [Capnocytophaga sp. oral taxon 324 str. F0483]